MSSQLIEFKEFDPPDGLFLMYRGVVLMGGVTFEIYESKGSYWLRGPSGSWAKVTHLSEGVRGQIEGFGFEDEQDDEEDAPWKA